MIPMAPHDHLIGTRTRPCYLGERQSLPAAETGRSAARVLVSLARARARVESTVLSGIEGASVLFTAV